jgi:hypothetical protein
VALARFWALFAFEFRVLAWLAFAWLASGWDGFRPARFVLVGFCAFAWPVFVWLALGRLAFRPACFRRGCFSLGEAFVLLLLIGVLLRKPP